MMFENQQKVECHIFFFLISLLVFILVFVSEKNMVVSLQLQKDNWSKFWVHQPEPVFFNLAKVGMAKFGHRAKI